MGRALADARQRVPQTSSLLPARRQAGGCRGFPIRKVWGFSGVTGLSKALPTWKSATQQVGNLRHTPTQTSEPAAWVFAEKERETANQMFGVV